MNQLSTINNDILKKSRELRISDLKNFEPIKDQLRRVFTLISLKTIPSKEGSPSEMDILLNFIFKNYPSLHPSEIYVAFEKAILREWEIKDYENWVKPFGDFNPDYFARIMAPYLIWRRDKISQEMKKIPTLIQEPKPIEKFTQLIQYWNLCKRTGQYQIPAHVASNALKDLTELGVIELNEEEANQRRAIFADPDIRNEFLKLHKAAIGYTIERNMGQFKAYCRQIRFKEWATEKLFEDYNLEDEITKRV